MFEISEGDLPFVRTRQALLVIDLQNDLVSAEGLLSVDKPHDLVEKVVELSTIFREAGNIIWVKSQFEGNRNINGTAADSEHVITDKEIASAKHERGTYTARKSKTKTEVDELCGEPSALDGEATNGLEDIKSPSEESFGNETFLTLATGGEARYLLPKSSAAEFPPNVCSSINESRDLIFIKSHYSAFKSSQLLQKLRGQFVTELFICGALTNISIFATALDAARHGYSITLVEDCLGYRSKARHDEALRQLAEATGCDRVASSELIEDIRAQQSAQSRPSNARRSGPETHDFRRLRQDLAQIKLVDNNNNNNIPQLLPVNTDPKPQESILKLLEVDSVLNFENPSHLNVLDSNSLSELLPKPPSSKMIQGDGKKRVQNKIKSRRRHSRTSPVDVTLSDLQHEKNGPEITHVEKPHSPTELTLTAGTETLKITPSCSPKVDMGSPVVTEAESISILPNVEFVQAEVKPPVQIVAKSFSDHGKLDSEEDSGIPASKPDGKDSATQGEFSLKSQDDLSSLCEGDTAVIQHLMPEDTVNDIFMEVRNEVRWQRMFHQGGEVPRLVAVQGAIGKDGSIPIYRHPADESPPLLPFTPTILSIKDEVEKRLGHSVNHCLIQFYRNGSDYISEHSDKTLDITPDTFIANVSLGAMRTMTFRTKKSVKNSQFETVEIPVPRSSCKAPLPHNSMCKLGLTTNMRWLHGIRQDKRMVSEKSEAELAYNGARISLTFRLIGTFLDKDQTKIWGQGAVAKHKKHARRVINGQTPEAEKMLCAFGKENHATEFDWPEIYGQGFDVLHMSNARKLFTCSDNVSNMRVISMLEEYGMDWTNGKLSPMFNWEDNGSMNEAATQSEETSIMFVDNDHARSAVQGDLAILLYVDSVHGKKEPTLNHLQLSRQFSRFQQAENLRRQWLASRFSVRPFRHALSMWESYASEDTFIAGPSITLADFAFWPVLHEIVAEWGDGIEGPCLMAYHGNMLRHKSIMAALASIVQEEKKPEV